MTKLSDRLEALAEEAELPQTCFADGPSTNRKIRYRDWETDRKSTRLNSSH